MTKFSVVINAGGQSTRMGTDKAFVDMGGRPMIERILEQTIGLGDPLIVTNNPEKYAYLHLPLVGDLLPDKGALGGLYTAIHAANEAYALVLACDMPFVNRPLLEFMMAQAEAYDAVVPRLMTEGGKVEAEPFRAIYAKTCLNSIRQALNSGQMRVTSFFPNINMRWVEEAEVKQFDPQLFTFKNCNTPEELEVVQALWQAQP